jgi:hypothetical protein
MSAVYKKYKINVTVKVCTEKWLILNKARMEMVNEIRLKVT